jgi:PAS domain S-box-containing protein
MIKSINNQLRELKLDIIILSLLISFFYRADYGEANYNTLANSVWLPSAISVYLIKLIASVFYKRKTFRVGDEKFWRGLFYTTTVLTGTSIGSSVFFVSGMSDDVNKIFILLLISATCSGSVSILATSLLSFIIFNSLSLLPYIVYYLNSDINDFRIVGYLIILFLTIISITAYRINRSLSRSLSLKIENDLIIEKLTQTEDKFAKSFYSGIAPMAMIDYRTAKIIDANNALLELLEYSRDEIIGKTPYDLNLNDKPGELIDIVVEAVEKKHLFNREITLRTVSGSLKHCFITIETFQVDNATIVYVMLQDFTERLEYENKLRIERERAEQATEAKSKFLASMSHEIRTPMNSILGMTDLALLTDNEDERKEYLETVKDSAEYLLTLINDILDLSKIEAGKIDIDLIDTDIHALIKSVYRLMNIHAINRKLTLEINITDDVPPFIKSAPERLKQILINLIGNALKFTPQGSVQLNAAVTDGTGYQHSMDYAEFVEFTVTDTGIGIAENKLELIFESFTQADSSTFRKYGGTGLGLSISKQLIKLMNGDIRVKSIAGQGSTFSFIIPLFAGVKPVKQDTDLLNNSCADKKRVLIAEDNALNRRLIEAYMKKLGHEFAVAENGEEVIALLKDRCFDVVLMDLEMPVMDGLESMKRIRNGAAGEENRTVVIHAMSAHIMQRTIDKCISEGFNGYITKPVNLKKLAALLE